MPWAPSLSRGLALPVGDMRWCVAMAALLAVQCVAGVRVGSGGGPLVRIRDDRDRHSLAAVQWGKKRNLPSKRPSPSDQRRLAAPPPTNTTALHVIDAIGRHWLIYERLTNLVLRSAGRVFGKIKAALGFFIDYPPRVMVVTMSGVIAHDSEVSAARISTAPTLALGLHSLVPAVALALA